MRVYLSGPMTGIPDLNFPAFDKARDKFLSERHWVVSPADLERTRTLTVYKDKLKDDLKALLWCDTIYMLKGWEFSVGARLELSVAQALGYGILFE